MARTPEQIAVDFLDDILVEYGFEKEPLYGLLNALEKVPYLAEVRPKIHLDNIGRRYLGGMGLHISATYTGDKQIGGARKSQFVAVAKPEIQEQVDALYADLAARTGFQFNSPAPNLTFNCCTAKVSMGKTTTASTSPQEVEVMLYKK